MHMWLVVLEFSFSYAASWEIKSIMWKLTDTRMQVSYLKAIFRWANIPGKCNVIPQGSPQVWDCNARLWRCCTHDTQPHTQLQDKMSDWGQAQSLKNIKVISFNFTFTFTVYSSISTIISTNSKCYIRVPLHAISVLLNINQTFEAGF